ncbi:MAG: hypothetical protein HYV28_15535 [Ignavibacteriales bacterium]|nr:hypothetical protein [Ignavibacteriales bacterium]
MKMMKGKKFGLQKSFGFQVHKELDEDAIITLSYDYTTMKAPSVFTLVRTQEAHSELSSSDSYDLIFEGQHFGAFYKMLYADGFSLDIGPVFSFVTRKFYYEVPNNSEFKIDDRLVSYCLGAATAIEYATPVGFMPNTFFIASMRIRYEHAVGFSARGRDLSNYYQDFLTTHLNVGFGFKL